MRGRFDFPSARYAKQEISPTLDESSQFREYLALLRVNPRLKLIYGHTNDQGMKTVTPRHESSAQFFDKRMKGVKIEFQLF